MSKLVETSRNFNISDRKGEQAAVAHITTVSTNHESAWKNNGFVLPAEKQ
jgi:hypothetical protein